MRRCPRGSEGVFVMAYIWGEAREQATMFPVTLDELIPADHMCRVIEAFVGRLEMAELGFVRAEPAETGRPGYDPRSFICTAIFNKCAPRAGWKKSANAMSKSCGCWDACSPTTRALPSSAACIAMRLPKRERSWCA